MATYWWCLHCERVVASGKRPSACPTPGCDGDYIDMWPWKEVRKINPGYPEKPVIGFYYPLYDTPKFWRFGR